MYECCLRALWNSVFIYSTKIEMIKQTPFGYYLHPYFQCDLLLSIFYCFITSNIGFLSPARVKCGHFKLKLQEEKQNVKKNTIMLSTRISLLSQIICNIHRYAQIRNRHSSLSRPNIVLGAPALKARALTTNPRGMWFYRRIYYNSLRALRKYYSRLKAGNRFITYIIFINYRILK